MNRNLALLALFGMLVMFMSACVKPFETPTPLPPATSTVTPRPSPSPTTSSTPTKTTTPLPGDMTQTFILSMDDNGYNHLFAYAPQRMAPLRLTNGAWDDIDPCINKDGSQVVFASNRNAYWDLYTINLSDGQVSRITDTPEYDGNPAWSPDDQWITYETMVDDRMQINILSITNPGQTIQLINDAAFNQDPSWSPLGREVAFVSNRSGDNEIWVANLDKPDEGRFINVSQSPDSSEIRPTWSPDGEKLAWASKKIAEPDGIYIWDSKQPEKQPVYAGAGDWPAWGASGNEIAARLSDANQDYLVAYSLDGTLLLPPTRVMDIRGLDWHLERVTSLPNAFYKQGQLTPTPLWQLQEQPTDNNPGQRATIVKIPDVDAPHPYLHDAVNEAFDALRRRIILDTGWDALASLENAYVPLTSALDPGKGQDWLFTGRAFAINPLTINAGWMVSMREEIDGRTYWRIYLRTLSQDGSQGEPLRELPWDLTLRYSLDPSAYDQGGAYAPSIPSGFWIDFTATAHKFGWERIPALENWRSYFKGAQFNEFIMSNGLDWREAMLQLYPPDIFITPTVIIPSTRTPTATPKGYYFKTATPTLTSTPTMRPTFTVAP